MRGKRDGAVGAALALLTLLAALFCVTAAFPALSRAVHSSAVADLCAPGHETLASAGREAPVAAVDAPCLKKTQPKRQHVRFGTPPTGALPAETGEMASLRASAHTQVRRYGPAPSPPGLAELSVRRL